MMRPIKPISIFLICLFGVASNAYEPVKPTVEEAIKNGRVAFIGRVLSTDAMGRSKRGPKAETHFSVTVPLYGLGVGKGKLIKIRHFSQNFIGYPEPVFGIQFLVNQEYLVVLKRKHRHKSGSFMFDSTMSKNADIAYRVKDSKGSPSFTLNRKQHYYTTIYGSGFKGTISFNLLIEWSNKRRSRLN